MNRASRLPSPILLLWLLVHATAATADQQCYYPDGVTKAPDVPCDIDATYSACCNINAFCLSNGLCISGGLLSRGSCTDSTWQDPACSTLCKSADTSGGVPLQPCNDVANTWACWTNNTACLDNDGVFTIDDGNTIVLRAYQVAALQTGTNQVLDLEPTTVLQVQDGGGGGGGGGGSGGDSTTTVTTTVTAPAGGAASTNSGATFTAGQVAGVGVGVGVPLLLALLGAIFIILRQRKQTQRAFSADNQHSSPPPSITRMRSNGPPSSQYSPSALSGHPSATSTRAYVQPYSPTARHGYPREMDPLAGQVNEADSHTQRQELEAETKTYP